MWWLKVGFKGITFSRRCRHPGGVVAGSTWSRPWGLSSVAGACWFGRGLPCCGWKNTHLESGFLPCLLIPSHRHFGSIDTHSARYRVGVTINTVAHPVGVWVCACVSCSVVSNSLWPHGLYLPGSSVHGISQNTGVDCPFLLQGIFLTQGSNPGFLHCRQILSPLSHQGSPVFYLSIPYWLNLGKLPNLSCPQ